MACGATTRSEEQPLAGTAGGDSGGQPNAGSASLGGNPPAKGGSASVSGSGGVATSSTELPPYSGSWAMFDFEDPVVVNITDSGGVLAGKGSCVPPEGNSQCSGTVQGSAHDRELEFSFRAGESGSSYRARAFVSEDGTRMSGFFAVDGPPNRFRASWARPTPGSGWLSGDYSALYEKLGNRAEGQYRLRLASAAGGGFETEHDYDISFRRSHGDLLLLSGALGAFWTGEMTWDEAAQTLVIGPVAATAPDVPTALRMRFDAATLKSVEATLPSGSRFEFSAVPAP
jgi:hypothetical protein